MISLIDHGSGNLKALCSLLKLSNQNFEIITRPEQVAKAGKLLLPGVGAFDRVMDSLSESSMADALNNRLYTGNAMCMGICVGMHVLADTSEEGNSAGLGFISGKVKKFDVSRICNKPKIPHMGWNSIRSDDDHPLLRKIDKDIGFYFLHSYHFECVDSTQVLGVTNHGYDFHSIVGSDGVYGVQFHPEKSHGNGVQLIKNFVEM